MAKTEFQRTWAINWQDGMLVTENHLNGVQDYIDELSRRISSSIGGDYGLVPDDRVEPNHEAILNWRVELVANTLLQVHILSCKAVAPDGSPIFIYPESPNYGVRFSGSKEVPESGKQKYSVLITPKEGKYKEIADPTHEEESGVPLYRIPDYSITIAGSVADQSKRNTLKIGQIIVDNGNASIDERYIPPCTALLCHKRLLDFAKTFTFYLDELEHLSAETTKRLMAKRVPQGIFTLNDPISRVLLLFSRRLAEHITDTIDEFKEHVSLSTPRAMVIFFKSFIRNLVQSLTFASENAQQQLFELWMKYLDSRFIPNDLEKSQDVLLGNPYNHERISLFLEYTNFALSSYINFYRALLGKFWIDDVKAPVAQPKPEPLPQPKPTPPPPQPKPVAPPPKVKKQKTDEPDFLLVDIQKVEEDNY